MYWRDSYSFVVGLVLFLVCMSVGVASKAWPELFAADISGYAWAGAGTILLQMVARWMKPGAKLTVRKKSGPFKTPKDGG